VYQITVLRIFLVVLVGTLLFHTLLYICGWREGIRLRKRRKTTAKYRYLSKKIICFYVMLLAFLVTLGFIIINYNIRGAR